MLVPCVMSALKPIHMKYNYGHTLPWCYFMFMGAKRLDSFTTEMIFDSQAVYNLDQSNFKLHSSLVGHKKTYLEKKMSFLLSYIILGKL